MKFAYEMNARERVQARKERIDRDAMTVKVEKAVSVKNTAHNAISILAEIAVLVLGFSVCWFFACL